MFFAKKGCRRLVVGLSGMSGVCNVEIRLLIRPSIHCNEHEHATLKQAYSVLTSVSSGKVARTLA